MLETSLVGCGSHQPVILVLVHVNRHVLYRTLEVVIELSKSKNDCYISVEVIYICIDNLTQECLKTHMIAKF